ncbi:caspase domain-containing protein [Streptomyces sp. NPDC056704]|uniref:caspase family protein n=1 Tax=Streptomyces sp. NPDC056704 TaxID=3345917 RepID=UPI0036BF42B9
MHWPARIPDRSQSLAVLVGVARYNGSSDDLTPLPQAAANVADLKRVLGGPTGLLEGSSVHTIVDPDDAVSVLTTLSAPGRGKLNLALFYFAGHGILDGEKQLCLALPNSIQDPKEAARTGIPVSAVFQTLKHVPAQHKLVILDCCYSGRALYDMSIGDAHVLAATGRTHKALTSDSERNTGFTGELLRILTEGLPDGPEFLDLHTLFRYLSVLLPTTSCPSDANADRRLPAPRHRMTDTTEGLALARNPAFGTGHSRSGLESRAVFAHRVAELGRTPPAGRLEHLAHAAALFGEIAADALTVLPATDDQALRYRRAHAALTGESGYAARAVAILDEITADLLAVSADCKAERLSIEHWSRRVPDPNTPGF